MVIFVMKFDVLPDKQQAYVDWLTKGGTLQTQLSVPGIIDLQGFRPIGGASEDITDQRRALLWAAIFEQRRQLYELELAWLQQTREKLFTLTTNPEGSEHG